MRCISIPKRSRWVLNAGGARVLMAMSTTSPTGFELALLNGFINSGAVTTSIVGSEANMAANIANKDLFIITNQASTATYGATAQASTVPGIVGRNQAFPASNAGFSTSFGTSSAATIQFSVTEGPLVTGETDSSVAVYSGSQGRNHASGLASGGVNIARGTGRGSNESTFFAFERGSTIDASVNGGVCAGRRVGIGIQHATAMTERGWQLWIDAINWCLGG